MDDSALAARAAAGDHDAFARLVDRHGGRVLAVATRIAGDRRLAEDLCQDVWVHLLRALAKYDPARPFQPWLLMVAANLCRNRVRGERRRPAASLDAMEDEAGGEFVPGTETSPGERIERRETARLVRAARDRLPESYRTILALRYEGDLSHEKIAQALGGLPIGTVKNRLHRAREALALHLEKTLGGEP
jgi:RNA polymerase sigma-70 factor (ECF subfamily)